jgi:excisionase family DNA binding protein
MRVLSCQDMTDTARTDSKRTTMTVEEAAKVLGISRGLAYQGVTEGSIPSIRIGRRILVPRARLMQLLGEEEE